METPEYRRILILYLGGFLKPHKFRRRSYLREFIVYNALQRESYAEQITAANLPLSSLLPHVTKAGYNQLSKQIDNNYNKALALRTHNMRELNKINRHSNKNIVDLLVKKYTLFEKLGII